MLREERDLVAADLTTIGSQPQTAIDPSAVFLVLMSDAMADQPALAPAPLQPPPTNNPSLGHTLDTYA